MFSKHFKLLSFKLCMSEQLIIEFPKNFVYTTVGTKYSTSLGNLIEAELWDDETKEVLKQCVEVDVEQYEMEMLANKSVRESRQLVLSTLKSPSNLDSIISTLKEMNSREYYLEFSFMDDHAFGICEHTFTMGGYLQDTEAYIEPYVEPRLLTFTNIGNKHMLAANMFKSNTCINLCDVSDYDLKGIKVPIGEATKVTSIIFDDGGV